MQFNTFMKNVFILLTVIASELFAVQFDDPFDPLKVKKISIISLEDMNKITSNCNIQQDAAFEYWPITMSFVNLLDELVEKQLQKMNYKSPFNRPIHKQFLGIQTQKEQRLVYIFVYPKPSRAIDKEEANPVLLCRKDSRDNVIFEFDKNTNTFVRITI